MIIGIIVALDGVNRMVDVPDQVDSERMSRAGSAVVRPTAGKGGRSMVVKDKKREQILADLQPVLVEDEEVLAATPGLAHAERMGKKSARRGTLFLTDRRVGIFTKKMGGHDLTDFAYGLLTSFEHKKGLTMCEVTIHASGATMQVRQIDKTEIDELMKLLRDRMAVAHNHGAPAAAAPSGVSAADEIAKLVALRDSGALSEEEFQAHKAKLL